MKKKAKMTIRSKINILVLMNILFVLLLVLSALSYITINRKFQETGNQALFLARTIAGLPEVIQAFHESNPSSIIQPFAEDMRNKTKAEFIVIANKDLIRYSHPNPGKIGAPLDGEDAAIDQKVLHGEEIQSTSGGSLGLTIRAKTPIFDENHHQIGLVSVGFLVQNTWKEIYSILLKIAITGVVALLFGLIGAYLLSGHIKKQIFNMEPHEIAFITQEQAAILNSIREGIIAINSEGQITTCNLEAKKILDMEKTNLNGRDISSVLPSSRLSEILEGGTVHRDEPMLIGNTLVITNRVPVLAKGKIIGAVATFRDKLHLDQIDQRLADIGQYVDSLRSQRHEFMNQLHLISGLIKMKEYDMVNDIIEKINVEQQNLLNFFLSRIQDTAVIGVLIGKMHRAKELGIQLRVDSNSVLPYPCPYRDIVITLLGNAIENSLEAIAENHTSTTSNEIIVCFADDIEHLTITVQDTGPGIDPKLGEDIFKDGISTKGSGRGFGLALLTRLVSKAGGELSVVSSPSGTILKTTLPKQGGASNE
ncbi:ATP-binding protein [Paenibacillus alginolyticus]|uniref:histidine kinase n=1 Tax=Paenibacillus alginolyticus TaxID=59839 RepID=A0ABT4G5Y1_9BACL|nr:sensor histidine kinase [Paenibacillus alginolyticus]MCY9691569.1 sensor histidine kinase [Paenibacillus alginolyticus]MEC0146995.1 sensor histidine kinase [Paenibacillus alginolyticus]